MIRDFASLLVKTVIRFSVRTLLSFEMTVLLYVIYYLIIIIIKLKEFLS